MTDRVSERRRAAQLARHYRDQGGLTIAEIARRLGRAEGTVKAYLYDPLGDKAREVKARYRAFAGAAARRPARATARA
ncbi:MAG: sigma-70 region 4 domain-containing protein, partial [Solirubrobacterales bacterium]|nr:sigma-70 region 4 domain-containing protein [Solirubrobacterales bacterium]